MTREIKFRGRNDEHGWLIGHYFVNRGVHFIVEDGIADPLNTWEDYAVAPDTIGQFTGLSDRNGKDVYEGDIALMDYADFNTGKDGKIYAVVRWIDYRAAFAWDAGLNYYVDLRNTDNVEICGNIHDNPELLEEESK